MRKVEQRAFNCRESGKTCTDPNCTVERCCEAVRIRVLENAPREKVHNRGVYEAIRRIARKIPKNSN